MSGAQPREHWYNTVTVLILNPLNYNWARMNSQNKVKILSNHFSNRENFSRCLSLFLNLVVPYNDSVNCWPFSNSGFDQRILKSQISLNYDFWSSSCPIILVTSRFVTWVSSRFGPKMGLLIRNLFMMIVWWYRDYVNGSVMEINVK